MSGDSRRQQLLGLLEESHGAPISAGTLAARFGVSRQVIVGDIALLRAAGAQVSATPRGYVMAWGDTRLLRTIACVHRAEDMEQELNIMVDNGCKVVDVIVEHPIYGQLTGPLCLTNRFEVGQFVKKCVGHAQPLSSLTGGIHLHTLDCPDEQSFARVREALDNAGFLLKE